MSLHCDFAVLPLCHCATVPLTTCHCALLVCPTMAPWLAQLSRHASALDILSGNLLQHPAHPPSHPIPPSATVISRPCLLLISSSRPTMLSLPATSTSAGPGTVENGKPRNSHQRTAETCTRYSDHLAHLAHLVISSSRHLPPGMLCTYQGRSPVAGTAIGARLPDSNHK